MNGHQDISNKELHDKAKLNIKADKLATEALNLKPIILNTNVATTEALLFINNSLVTAKHSKVLRNIFHSISLRENLLKSNVWSQTTIEQILWDVHAKAKKKLTFGREKFIIKYIHNRLPCNSRQHKYYQYKDLVCKICMSENETQQHFLPCTGCVLINKMRKEYLYKLRVLMENTRMTPVIQQSIYWNVNNWLYQIPIVDVQSISPDASNVLIRANTQLLSIGWENCLKGRMSREWGTLKFLEIKTKGTPTRYATLEKWAVEMILLTWNFLFETWLQRNKYEHD